MKTWDGCNEALIGTGSRCGSEDVAVYDYSKLITVFIEQGMTAEESIEWIEFNILGAYVGEDTPIIMFTKE